MGKMRRPWELGSGPECWGDELRRFFSAGSGQKGDLHILDSDEEHCDEAVTDVRRRSEKVLRPDAPAAALIRIPEEVLKGRGPDIDSLAGDREKIIISGVAVGTLVREVFPALQGFDVTEDGTVILPDGKVVIIDHAVNIRFSVPDDSMLVILVAEHCQIEAEKGAVVVTNNFIWPLKLRDQFGNEVESI